MIDIASIDYDLVAKVLGVDRRTLPTVDPTTDATPPPPPRILIEALTDAEWEVVKLAMPPLPVPRAAGFRDREFFDAAIWHLSAADRGHGWAALPTHFPPRMTMQHRWLRWAVAATWEMIAETLEDDERLSAARRDTFRRIAANAAQRRERILESRRALNESL